ncbi:GDP-Man:Man(3)GlcNAc(2)-PP-Dol alpha-1,2-mannosyltransferase isoform X1 [Hetaerina americana]|uniref:GDP-Man:Man(3)GlcNAc(2)-PP-Dol alpha-1,2-mannosyltransferase isoform X1 n=1 Tax=Hetaerina americana TaxID=62018 RepID=UPI003A7F591C
MLLSFIHMFFISGVLASCIIIAIFVVFLKFLQVKIRRRKASQEKAADPVVAFFHPYCNAGGGGERVLWCALKALQARYPESRYVVYTGDVDVSPDEILRRVGERFNISLVQPVEFVYLRKRRWVEAYMYPYFTLLGQSIGSMYLGLEALLALVPDIFIDTTGYAFTLPLFRYLGGCEHIGCYVHYPTITSDMLKRVSSRVATHNNRSSVARSPLLTAGKLMYYRTFATLYSWAGNVSDIVMANSSWTEEHLHRLWNVPLRTHRIYPPCDVDELKAIPLKDDTRKPFIQIVSVGQFRPEKDHPLQIRAMYQLRQMVSEETWSRIKLIFIGSCRGSEDENRVKDMQDLCRHFSLEDNVEFKVNVPYNELKEELQEGTIGLHAMWNEHFGIGVVECMAAGLIMVAHRSGGPLADIIVENEGSRNGFLASDEVEYAQCFSKIIGLSPAARGNIREAARSSVNRFSVKEFEEGFLRATQPFFSKKT